MNPTQAGITTTTHHLTDTLHTLHIPHTPRDTYHLHQLVSAATKGTNRPLWATPRKGTLVIRSPHLNETTLPPETAATTTTTPIPETDTHVEWALIANPTRTTPTPLQKNGTRPKRRRYPIPEEEVPEWVNRKLIGPLTDITVTGIEKIPTSVGYRQKTRHRITHTRYALNGTATVTNQKKLADLLHAGVGPGKAFGCGLLITKETP